MKKPTAETSSCDHCGSDQVSTTIRVLSIRVNWPGHPTGFTSIPLGKCCLSESCAMALLAASQRTVSKKLKFDTPKTLSADAN